MRPKAGKCTPSVWKWVAGGKLPGHFIECAKYLASQRRSNRHLSWMWRRQQNTVATTSSGTAIKSIGSQSLPSTCRSGVPLSTYRGVHNSHQSLWQYGKKKKKEKQKKPKKEAKHGLLNTSWGRVRSHQIPNRIGSRKPRSQLQPTQRTV